mmetsp:Transcript_6740/g.28257  ORF Transcript_6740/g.28257 Transcript_6740/m.28257 type:complete len:640 (+) Transcript_6740:1723-3642(+)
MPLVETQRAGDDGVRGQEPLQPRHEFHREDAQQRQTDRRQVKANANQDADGRHTPDRRGGAQPADIDPGLHDQPGTEEADAGQDGADDTGRITSHRIWIRAAIPKPGVARQQRDGRRRGRDQAIHLAAGRPTTEVALIADHPAEQQRQGHVGQDGQAGSPDGVCGQHRESWRVQRMGVVVVVARRLSRRPTAAQRAEQRHLVLQQPGLRLQHALLNRQQAALRQQLIQLRRIALAIASARQSQGLGRGLALVERLLQLGLLLQMGVQLCLHLGPGSENGTLVSHQGLLPARGAAFRQGLQAPTIEQRGQHAATEAPDRERPVSKHARTHGAEAGAQPEGRQPLFARCGQLGIARGELKLRAVEVRPPTQQFGRQAGIGHRTGPQRVQPAAPLDRSGPASKQQVELRLLTLHGARQLRQRLGAAMHLDLGLGQFDRTGMAHLEALAGQCQRALARSQHAPRQVDLGVELKQADVALGDAGRHAQRDGVAGRSACRLAAVGRAGQVGHATPQVKLVAGLEQGLMPGGQIGRELHVADAARTHLCRHNVQAGPERGMLDPCHRMRLGHTGRCKTQVVVAHQRFGDQRGQRGVAKPLPPITALRRAAAGVLPLRGWRDGRRSGRHRVLGAGRQGERRQSPQQT